MNPTDILILLATGLLSGLVGGLLGVGGGIVVVPVLITFLPQLGALPNHLVHYAVATSLFTVLFTNISSTWAHWKQGNVVRRLVLFAAPAAALAGGAGAFLTRYLPGDIHRRIFGVFLLVIAMRMLFEKAKQANRGPWPAISTKEAGDSVSVAGAMGSGFAIGLLAGLLGIGGGSLAVPLFHLAMGLPIHWAVGSSAAVGGFAALLGTLGHGLSGPLAGEGGLAYTIGFIHWPAAVAISLTAIVSAQLGARLAGKIKPAPLRRVFGAFLSAVAVKLVL